MLIVHPDSHIHSDLLPEHVAWVLNKFKNRDGFFKESVEMPKSLPALNNALYGPAAGDPPIAESDVVYIHRPGGKSRLGKSRMVHRPMRKTRVITVIAGPHDGHPMVVYTMHGGHPAEREPFDEDIKTPAQQAAADTFWATHALATGKKAKARANANDETRMYLKLCIERLGEVVGKIGASESFIRGRQQDDATITDDEDAALERAMAHTKAARESTWLASKEVGSVTYPKARTNVGDAARPYAHLSDAELEARITTALQGMQYWRGYNPSFYDMAEKEWDALTAEKKRRARPNTTVHAHDLDCPSCGAPAGYYCNSPKGKALKTPHKERRLVERMPLFERHFRHLPPSELRAWLAQLTDVQSEELERHLRTGGVESVETLKAEKAARRAEREETRAARRAERDETRAARPARVAARRAERDEMRAARRAAADLPEHVAELVQRRAEHAARIAAIRAERDKARAARAARDEARAAPHVARAQETSRRWVAPDPASIAVAMSTRPTSERTAGVPVVTTTDSRAGVPVVTATESRARFRHLEFDEPAGEPPTVAPIRVPLSKRFKNLEFDDPTPRKNGRKQARRNANVPDLSLPELDLSQFNFVGV